MKKILVIFVLINSFSFSQDYPHLTELRGLEDSLDNTHLFYREVYPSYGCWSKNIWQLDVTAKIDTLFITDGGVIVYPGSSCEGTYINDYEFFNNDPAKFFYCGYELWIDPVAKLIRYDEEIQIPAFALTEIEISRQDENKVYVADGPSLFKSTDGGYNFEFVDSTQEVDVSLISLSKNDDSQIYGIDDNNLIRSEDDGDSYTIVDNSGWSEDSKLFYDIDGNHIYGLSNSYDYQTQSYTGTIFISDDNGNSFTWDKRIEYAGNLFFTLDENQSGEIYYSAGKRIFKSTDFGSSFILYKELERNVTGLYKKSGSDILYASTPLKIFEIKPDSIQIIKELPITEGVFSWLPLSVGNKWIYDSYEHIEYYEDKWKTSREVVENKIIDNEVYTRVLVSKYRDNSNIPEEITSEYLRIDSSSGLIYKASVENDTVRYEELYMDLLAEINDTIPVGNGISFTGEIPFNLFGVDTYRREFEYVITPYQIIDLVKGFGLEYQIWEEVGTEAIDSLQGCIIDGVVYGDTALVTDVNDPDASVFIYKLKQNYPNPFNPTTNIGFRIANFGLVTLKVYDILGEEVVTLVNEEKPAGEYSIKFDATDLPSGVYFYQLKAEKFVQTKKLILIK